MKAMRPLITVSNLTKTCQGGITALRSINLEIREGEARASLGAGGAGKSTQISIPPVVTPPVFPGGGFYSVDMRLPLWQKITLLNPVMFRSPVAAGTSARLPT